MSEALLKNGLAQLGLKADDDQIAKLLQFVDLIQQWNKVYNLTAITQADKMLSYHVLDSLAIQTRIAPDDSCLDVGTGAGLPGIPLAIMLPGTKWLLLDSNGKKTRFVQQVIASCALSNVKVVQSRVQDYHAESQFDVIVSRAYASIGDFTSSVDHLWQADTRLMSMKTQMAEQERQAVDETLFELEILPLKVPGVSESRSLVAIKRRKK